MKKIVILVILVFLIVAPSSFAWNENSPLGKFLNKLFGIKIVKAQPSAPVQQAQPAAYSIKHEEKVVPLIQDYSSFYNTFRISVHGVEKQDVVRWIKNINPSYFDGVSELEVVYTNKAVSETANGIYYSDNKKIRVYYSGESDEYSRMVVLHELVHHYCWNVRKEMTTNHNGCFMDTPLHKDYGRIS